MRPRVLALFTVLTAAGGCESFGEGDLPASSPDGGAATPDATDGAAPDGTTSSGDLCGDRTAPALFAARFDKTTPPFEFEELVDLQDPGTEAFEHTTDGPLAGNALRVTVNAGANSSHNAWLRRSIDPTGLETKKRIRLDFDFVVEKAGHDYAVLGGLFFRASPSDIADHGIALRARGAQLDELRSGSLSVGPPFFENDVLGKPHHGVVCVVREGTTTNVRRIVLVDGVPVDDRRDLPLGGATGLDIRIGLFYTSHESVETRVVYDDVELRVD